MSKNGQNFVVIASSTRPTVKTVPVLLCVESLGTQRLLDVELTATEDATVYTRVIREDDVDMFRQHRSGYSQGSWKQVLSWLLLGHNPDLNAASREIIDSIFLEAWTEDAAMIISVRQTLNIGTINEDIEIGRIALQEDQRKIDEISMFDWATRIAKDNYELKQEVKQLFGQVESEKKSKADLKEQLESLIRERRNHETALLEKLRHIINAKKLKIRDQQRLLMTANANDGKETVSDEKRSLKARPSTAKSGRAQYREKRRSSAERVNAAKSDSNDHESSDAGDTGSDDAFENVLNPNYIMDIAKSDTREVRHFSQHHVKGKDKQQSSERAINPTDISSGNATDEEL